MSERESELAAQGAPLAAAEPFGATRPDVARARRAAQLVLGLLFILGAVGLLYWGREALPPFFLGLIVAYMLLPPVRRVERTLPSGGLWQTVRRPIAAVAVSLCTLFVMAFLLRRLAQPVIEQTAQILGSLEELWSEAQANAPGIRDWYALNVPEIARGWIDDGFQSLGQAILSLGGNVGGWIVSFTSNALSSVVAIIAVPLFVIYFLFAVVRALAGVMGDG